MFLVKKATFLEPAVALVSFFFSDFLNLIITANLFLAAFTG